MGICILWVMQVAVVPSSVFSTAVYATVLLLSMVNSDRTVGFSTTPFSASLSRFNLR